MTPEELYAILEGPQRERGYRFNPDRDRTVELLEGLLVNKERYGYMGCPCRLCTGDPDWDRDIICPCAYREADVKEYGACYCNLYVSESWEAADRSDLYVPERRPPEKFVFRGRGD